MAGDHGQMQTSDEVTEDEEICSICVLCGKDFPYMSLLHEHAWYTHKVVLPRVMPLPDSRNFSHLVTEFYEESDTETSTSTPSDKKPIRPIIRAKSFICPICKGGFTTNSYLHLHIKTVHHGAKPFVCPVCSNRYTQKHSLKKHMQSKHKTGSDGESKTTENGGGDDNNGETEAMEMVDEASITRDELVTPPSEVAQALQGVKV